MSSSLVVKPHLPSQAVVPPIQSSSKHVLRKQFVEVPSNNSSSEFKFSGTDRIEFDINSPSSFWDPTQSYVRLDLTTDLTYEGQDDLSRYLAEGGAHALFRNMSVRTQSGVEICRVENYNRWYAMMASTMMSRDYVDRALHREGDSADGYSQVDGFVSSNLKELTGSAFAYDETGGASEKLLTGTASKFLDELRVGDLIVLVDDDGISNTLEVGSITSNTVANLLGGGADITANTAKVFRPSYQSNRAKIAQTDNSSLCFQPALPFLQMADTWIPLFLIKGGLRICMELERPEYVICSPKSLVSAGWTGADYAISNPYYVCAMIQPDQSLAESYLQMYKAQGLAYHFINIHFQSDFISAGSTGRQNLVVNAGVRSARNAMCKIQNLRAQTVTAATVNGGKSTFTADSIAMGLKANLNEFQIESGSERFPLSGPVDCSSIDNSELMAHLQETIGSLGVVMSNPRFLREQWQEIASNIEPFEQGAVAGKADSDRLVIACNFARDSSPFTGLDLSLNSLNIQPNFDAVYQLTDDDGSSNAVNAALYWLTFIQYDAVLSLSQEGVRVFR